MMNDIKQMFCPTHNIGKCNMPLGCDHRGTHAEMVGCNDRCCSSKCGKCVPVDEGQTIYRELPFRLNIPDGIMQKKLKKTIKTYGQIGHVKYIIHDEDTTVSFIYPRRVVIKVAGHEMVLVM